MLPGGPASATELADGGSAQKRPATAAVLGMARPIPTSRRVRVQQHKPVTAPMAGQEPGGAIGLTPWQWSHQGKGHGLSRLQPKPSQWTTVEPVQSSMATMTRIPTMAKRPLMRSA